MQWYELFILSVLELLGILLVWSKLNRKLSFNISRWCLVIGIIAVIAVTMSVYSVEQGFIINLMALCSMVIILYKIPIQEGILQFLAAFIIVASIQFLFTSIPAYLTNPIDYSLTNGLIINIANLTVCIAIYKFIEFDIITKYYLKYRNHMITIIINITGIILLLMYLWDRDRDFVWQHITYLILAMIIWEGLNIFFLYQSVHIKEQEEIIHIHEKYLLFVTDMVHDVRQKQHDFKNHLSALYGLAQMEDYQQAQKEIRQYLEEVIEDIKSTDQLLNIKDPIISAIINSKKSLAEERGISFDVEFQNEIPEYPFQKHELAELLGNLLDNAIEAIESSSHHPGKIAIMLGTEEKSKIIEVKNTGGPIPQGDIHRIFERGFSTKQGKHRGYGLYKVRKIVNYYQGTIELSFNEGYIAFKVLL